jgi:hypothetical protein
LRYDLGDGCPGICGWGNTEEFYTSDTSNIALNGQGQLAITARGTGRIDLLLRPMQVHVREDYDQRQERSAAARPSEARIKLAVGQGLWPAFWMLGTDIDTRGWPQCGELDIMEYRGSAPATASSAVHGPGYSGNTPFVRASTLTSGTYASEFHTFMVEWDASAIRYFIDSTLYYTVSRGSVELYGEWVFDKTFYVILNQAVGGNFDQDPQSDAIFPATMLIDYVRVYRKQ